MLQYLRKLLLILSCVVFTAGCGNTLKSSWTNFRAYYNTYYNAEKNFRAGYKKVQDQPSTVDPASPVRIHPAPVQAGNSDFQQAIDKGAKILRKFPESKWADDAILLIGKSYYYRQDFFPALQKFEELRDATTTPKMEQLSIIWKGRTQLDLNSYSDGISFLESELQLYPEDWSKQKKAEIQALVGQHHAMLANWEQAANYLSRAVQNLQDSKLLGRTHFLHGQVLERLERYGEAYFAFSNVSNSFSGFDLIYWSQFKQADVARKEGNFDQAIAIYERLRKDDKNVDRREDLMYEIARTLELKGNTAEAENRYNRLLHGRQQGNTQTRDLRADIYYRLGKIYSEQYDNYATAAAYFDSSSTINDQANRIDATQDAQTLADAFGKYTRLQNTIQRADSLLRLGAMPKAQLDSALRRIRAQKRKQMREQEAESENTLANRNQVNIDDQQTASSVYGFLNHRNDELIQRAKAQFQIVWGDRPLIDNWRRIEVVRQSNVSSEDSSDGVAAETPQKKGTGGITLNLAEIPQTSEDKTKLKTEKVNAQFQLGNLLYMNLNAADRARRYFYEVINSEISQELRPQAMYSLIELYRSKNEQDSLQHWKDRILQEYPDTRYARRVEQKLSDAPVSGSESDSTGQLVRQYQQIMNATNTQSAARLRKLALANRSSDLAPYIYYSAIEAYIRQAKYHHKKVDSLYTSQNDTSALADSMRQTISSIDHRSMFSGAHWDSVRFAVQEFDTTFPNAQQQKKVAKLHKMLEQAQSNNQQMVLCGNPRNSGQRRRCGVGDVTDHRAQHGEIFINDYLSQQAAGQIVVW